MTLFVYMYCILLIVNCYLFLSLDILYLCIGDLSKKLKLKLNYTLMCLTHVQTNLIPPLWLTQKQTKKVNKQTKQNKTKQNKNKKHSLKETKSQNFRFRV